MRLSSEHFHSAKALAKTTAFPIVVLHGLFGSKQNWRALAKSIALATSQTVHTLDLRNHGESPHSDEHSYRDMADDVVDFIKENIKSKASIVGHSMGGKVALHLAGSPHVHKSIIVDASPLALPSTLPFKSYCETMAEIDRKQCLTFPEASKIMVDAVGNAQISQFLMTNYKMQPEGKLRFRVNVPILAKSLSAIAEPMKQGSRATCLFICGANSPYVPVSDHPEILKMFPNATFEVVQGAAHWVHVDKPAQFLNMCNRWLADRE